MLHHDKIIRLIKIHLPQILWYEVLRLDCPDCTLKIQEPYPDGSPDFNYLMGFRISPSYMLWTLNLPDNTQSHYIVEYGGDIVDADNKLEIEDYISYRVTGSNLYQKIKLGTFIPSK